MSETTTLDVSRKLRDAGIEIKTTNTWPDDGCPDAIWTKEISMYCAMYNYPTGEPDFLPAPDIAELRAYIEGKGEWEEFVGHLFEIYGVPSPRLGDTIMYYVDFKLAMNELTNADSLALAYLGWKEKKG